MYSSCRNSCDLRRGLHWLARHSRYCRYPRDRTCSQEYISRRREGWNQASCVPLSGLQFKVSNKWAKAYDSWDRRNWYGPRLRSGQGTGEGSYSVFPCRVCLRVDVVSKMFCSLLLQVLIFSEGFGMKRINSCAMWKLMVL